jgi:erythromycin esterase-like protein
MPPGRRWSWWSGTALALVAALGPGCRSYERPTELLAAQARYFATPTAPDGVPDRVVAAIAGADVLLLGEEHHVQEHHDFVAVLLPRLHERGFRRVLCEANHAYGWLLDEYVKGARDTLAEKQWNLGRDWIEAIRALNAGLRAGGRAGEQISVGCCDVNHWDDSYRESLAALAERYRSQPLAALVAQLPATADTAYLPAVAAIADAAAGDPARLGLDAAGAAVVTATTRVELASAGYRTSRSDAAREEVLHQNVTAAIDRLAPGGKLAVVCGMSHAQLRPAWRMHSGRAWEWLGTRLAARYAATPGKLYSLACFAARGQHKPNFRSKERFDVDVQSSASSDDLSRALDMAAAGRIAFLDLTDTGVDEEAKIWFGRDSVMRPGELFSGLLMYPRSSVARASVWYEDNAGRSGRPALRLVAPAATRRPPP